MAAIQIDPMSDEGAVHLELRHLAAVVGLVLLAACIAVAALAVGAEQGPAHELQGPPSGLDHLSGQG